MKARSADCAFQLPSTLHLIVELRSCIWQFLSDPQRLQQERNTGRRGKEWDAAIALLNRKCGSMLWKPTSCVFWRDGCPLRVAGCGGCFPCSQPDVLQQTAGHVRVFPSGLVLTWYFQHIFLARVGKSVRQCPDISEQRLWSLCGYFSWAHVCSVFGWRSIGTANSRNKLSLRLLAWAVRADVWVCSWEQRWDQEVPNAPTGTSLPPRLELKPLVTWGWAAGHGCPSTGEVLPLRALVSSLGKIFTNKPGACGWLVPRRLREWKSSFPVAWDYSWP